MRAHPHDTAVCILRHLLSCSVWRVSTDSLWQSCFADGTRGLTAAARCTRLQPASGCSRERRVRCVSAPETELFSPSYFSLHGTIRTSQLSAYATSVFTMPVLLCCQCIYVRVPRAPGPGSLSSCHCIYGPRHGTPSPSQLCARVRVSHGLSFRAALMPSSVAIYSLSPSRAGLLSLHLCVYSPSPSQAGLLSRCCVYSPKDSESVTARVRVRHELGCKVAADAFLRPVLHNLKSDLVTIYYYTKTLREEHPCSVRACTLDDSLTNSGRCRSVGTGNTLSLLRATL